MSLYATSVTKIFDAVVTAASGVSTSAVVDLSSLRDNEMAVQLTVTGDGTLTLAYAASVNGTDFTVFDGVSAAIKTGLTKTSGAGGNGKILLTFTPKTCEFIRFTLTETGTANSATVTAHLVTR